MLAFRPLFTRRKNLKKLRFQCIIAINYKISSLLDETLFFEAQFIARFLCYAPVA